MENKIIHEIDFLAVEHIIFCMALLVKRMDYKMDRKKVVIHDLRQDVANTLLGSLSSDYVVIDANAKSAKCIGCFECWLKKPGFCKFPDKLQTVGQLVLSSEKLIIITEMLYGGVSIPVKRVLDRSIPGITPFFKKREGKLHHLQRYKSETEVVAVFYNAENLSDSEKAQGEEYVKAMGLNYNSMHNDIYFINGTDLRGVKL